MMSTKAIKRTYIVCLALAAVMIATGIFLCGTSVIEMMNPDYVRDMAFGAMGMLVGGIFLIGLFAEDSLDKQNRSMFRIIFILMALFFMDIMSLCMEGNSKYVTGVALVNTLVFVFEDLLGYSYWTYIRDELQLKGRFLKIADKICIAVLGLTVLLDLFNLKLGYFFTVSESAEYIDSPFEFVGDLAIITVFVLALIAIIRMKETSIRERLILLTFEVFPTIAYAIGIATQQYIWVYPAYLLSVMLIYIRIFAARGKKVAEQQVIMSKQSTALMISQIQPHFLYNVLTTISNLCVTDPEEAEETTVLFSQYLRTNLDSLRKQEPVPFMTELSHIKTYVELEKKRFGEKLNVTYDINESNFQVPSLGIQPIVENSIKHGIRGKNSPGHITIASYKTDDGYKVVIEDDGIGFDMNMPAKEDGRSHVGMINVRERLRQMCNASMKIESSPGNGCRTEIIFPDSYF